MESGGHGVWNWRLVPISNARGWEERTWDYNAAYAESDPLVPGLMVNYGWSSDYDARYGQLRVNAGTEDWTGAYGVTVAPGQLYFHPERAVWHVISFTPFETGEYAVDGFLRHFNGEKLTWGMPDTLTAELRCGGRTLHADSGRGKVFDLTQASFACRAGEEIALWIRVDADWSNYGAAASIAFGVSQLAKSESATVWRISDALKAVKASDTPRATEMDFADGTGICLGAAKGGLFDPFTAMDAADSTKWWMNIAWDFLYPWIVVGDADDTFKLFPGSTKTDATYTHVKIGWTAPADGLYRTSGYLAHVGGHSGTWGTSPTLEGGVMLAEDGNLHRYGTFHNTTSAANGTGMGVDASRLWLRKGEKVWFATGPQEKSKNTNYMADMTARLTMARDDLETLPQVIAFDFGAPDADGYAGRGVEGFSDMAFWNRCAVAEGSTGVRFDSLHRMDKKLVGVRLELSPIDEGKTLATGTADGAACALYGDGVASASTADVVNWTISGLVRGKTYTLTFYGRSPCVFTVGNGVRLSPKAGNVWMTTEGGEYCRTTVVATEKTLGGQFYSSSDAQALWTGLQVSGESFRECSGIAIVIR